MLLPMLENGPRVTEDLELLCLPASAVARCAEGPVGIVYLSSLIACVNLHAIPADPPRGVARPRQPPVIPGPRHAQNPC